MTGARGRSAAKFGVQRGGAGRLARGACAGRASGSRGGEQVLSESEQVQAAAAPPIIMIVLMTTTTITPIMIETTIHPGDTARSGSALMRRSLCV